MEEPITLDFIVNLITERNDVYDEYTETLVDALRPTLLAAVIEVLQVRDNQVMMNDIDMSDELILNLECAVKYNTTDVVPAFVTAIAPLSEDGSDIRIIRIGIPLAQCLLPSADIVAFFNQLIDTNMSKASMEPTPPQLENVLDQFDLSGLSKSQISQLLIFQHNTAKVKH